MPAPDEPLPAPDSEEPFEEVSADLIFDPDDTLPGAVVPGDTLPGAVLPPGAEPSDPLATAPREPSSPRPAPRGTPAKPRRGPEDTLPPFGPDAGTRPLTAPDVEGAPSRHPVLLAALLLACGFAAGLVAGRAWERRALAAAGATGPATSAAPEPATDQEARPPAAPEGPRDAARPARKAAPPRDGHKGAAAGKGKLVVRAPPGAQVLLDGRRIGRGSLETDVSAGWHRVEVRLGKARASERFVAEPGTSWTYEVTPTSR